MFYEECSLLCMMSLQICFSSASSSVDDPAFHSCSMHSCASAMSCPATSTNSKAKLASDFVSTCECILYLSSKFRAVDSWNFCNESESGLSTHPSESESGRQLSLNNNFVQDDSFFKFYSILLYTRILRIA